MCDPVTLAGIALTAGSAVMNGVAQSRVARERDQVLAAERIRQQGFDQEAQALNTHSRDLYKNFSGQQAQKADELGAYFGKNSDPGAANASAAGAMPSSSSAITTNEQATQGARTDAFVGQQANALGDLRSFGETLGGASRAQARDAGAIGQIGSFRKGSAGVLPLELDQSTHAGDGFKFGADIMGGLGSIGTMYGMSHPGSLGGLFGGAATSAAPSTSLGSLAAGRAADFASMPGYTAMKPKPSLFSLF